MKKILALLLLGSASLGIQSASAGLISQYQFNNDTADSIRGGAATVSGSAQYAPGVNGSAFLFNGSTYLSAPLPGSGLTALTITAWVKYNQQTDWANIVSNWGSSAIGAFYFGLNNTEFKISNYLGYEGGSYNGVSSPITFTTGRWYNVGVTFGPSGNQKLYVDGVVVATGAATPGAVISDNIPIMSIGAKLDDAMSGIGAPPGYLNGLLDDVSFYDNELSLADMNAIVAAGPSSAVPEPGQVAASLLLLGGIGGYVFLKRRKAAKPAVATA
jgi:hypothetical protein